MAISERSQGAGGRYPFFARIMHWGMAALVLALIAAGFAMVQEGLPQATQNALFVFHKNAGLLVLLAVLVRLAYRMANPPPPLPAAVGAAQRRVAGLSHAALYALMIAMPVLGHVRVKAGGFPIETLDAWGVPALVPRSDALASAAKAAHFAGALALTALAALHISAALYHAAVLRDGVFARMGFGASR
mgnify:CR=1 FL=1